MKALFDILLLIINDIFDFSVHTFLMFCFLSCCVSSMGKRQTLKKKKTTSQIGIFNAVKGKRNAKVHLIKIMKGSVKIFQDQGAAVSKVQFQRSFIFKKQIVSLNLS